MSFGQLVIGTTTFLEGGRGRYINSALPFGGPADEIRISPGSTNKKAAIPTTTLSLGRTKQIPVIENGQTVHRRCQVVTTYTLEKGVSMTDADALAEELSLLATESFLTQVANGTM